MSSVNPHSPERTRVRLAVSQGPPPSAHTHTHTHSAIIQVALSTTALVLLRKPRKSTVVQSK